MISTIMYPFVSVIVPIYNVAPYIERCARSLLEQSFQSVEYIFVNDCTPDNSIEILEGVIKEYPNRTSQIRIIHNTKNIGLAATRFVGLDMANGKYILHCDSDDWVETNMLQCMYDAAIKEDADIVCCEAIKELANGKCYYRYTYDEETNYNGLLDLQVSEIHVAIWNKLIKKELFTRNNIRNYDGINMGEDSAITIRLRFYSKKTIIIHKALYHYNRMNNNSITHGLKEFNAKMQIELAKHITEFFIQNNCYDKYRGVINFYKFISKQYYLTQKRDIKKWRSIFPECHIDIIKFRQYSIFKRIKWLICAYFPFAEYVIKPR